MVYAAGSDGSSLRSPARLDSTERRQHMMLWSRRLATQGITTAKPPSVALRAFFERQKDSVSTYGKKMAGGASYAHEIAADDKGVAFAFGGVGMPQPCISPATPVVATWTCTPPLPYTCMRRSCRGH